LAGIVKGCSPVIKQGLIASVAGRAQSKPTLGGASITPEARSAVTAFDIRVVRLLDTPELLSNDCF
jgi:hypothetical protein